jgi:16S rRNA (guanine(966)-N(2))-methyltransferase RsmD
MLRITGGIHKGSYVLTASKRSVRYTSARVREAIFDMVEVEDLEVLDLFSGSGLLAFEALSRGARHATCVEKDPEMVKLIKRNVERLDMGDRISLIPRDVRVAVPMLHKSSRRYDIIFLDPPYGGPHMEMAVRLLLKYPLDKEQAIFVFEYSKGMVYAFADFETVSRKVYGGTVVDVLRRR